ALFAPWATRKALNRTAVIANDQFSFSYSNHFKRQNKIFSHIDINDLKSEEVLDFDTLDIEKIKKKNVYAYSHEEDRILENRKWSLYTCIVAEIDLNGEYFVLAGGEWKKVDNEFYDSVTNFIEKVLQESSVPPQYHNFKISDDSRNQNREEIFIEEYCRLNEDAILFDQAKLKIGQGSKDKEFCDIFECKKGELASIIHVKNYNGSSSLNYLFSQARFYCEFFLSDATFLNEIRSHIANSCHPQKAHFLDYIKDNQADLYGKDYIVKLWILYNRYKDAPKKSDLPLMAKYELKMTYERLRNILKFREVSLSMIPVEFKKFKIIKNGNG
ncbi:TIGR04141 family sporadically distributed protein, partial [bacterium]|nr:TIGR04141 family sporadically distributed protein [bacterium]